MNWLRPSLGFHCPFRLRAIAILRGMAIEFQFLSDSTALLDFKAVLSSSLVKLVSIPLGFHCPFRHEHFEIGPNPDDGFNSSRIPLPF